MRAWWRGPGTRLAAGQERPAMLLALFAAIAILALRHSYRLDILTQIGILFLVVMGMDLLIGFGGQLSLGQQAFMGIGAYASAVATIHFGLSPWVGLAVGVAISMIAATVVSPVLRLTHFYFAMATLAFSYILISLLQSFSSLTGGGEGLSGLPKLNLGGFALDSELRFAVLVWAIVVVAFWICRNVGYSRTGRALKAIRADEVAAGVTGVAVSRYKLQVFLLSAVLASVAGSLYAHFRNYIHPETFGNTMMVETFLMLFLGGVRTVWGGLLGVTLLKSLPEVMGGAQEYKLLIYGVVFVLVLLFMPGGLAGGVTSLLARARRLKWLPAPILGRAETQISGEQREGLLLLSPEQKAPRESSPGPILQLQGLNKSFGGLRALDNIGFAVSPGQVKSVIGPNGAGKTTLFNLITGVYRPDSGTVNFEGVDTTRLKSEQICTLGIGRVFQVPRLFHDMTVLENVMVGHRVGSRAGFFQSALALPSSRQAESRMREHSQALLALVALDGKAGMPPGSLPHGQKKLAELARALATGPSLLLLDEPAAGLNDAEKEQYKELLLKLRSEGVTILLVEHDMNFVMGISDYIVVLNFGKEIAEGTPQEIQRNEEVIAAYLGSGD